MISNILSTDRLTVMKSVGTHAFVTEAHSAWFSFAEEKEVAIFLDEGRADAISPAADFTGVLRFWKQETRSIKIFYFKRFTQTRLIHSETVNHNRLNQIFGFIQQISKRVLCS